MPPKYVRWIAFVIAAVTATLLLLFTAAPTGDVAAGRRGEGVHRSTSATDAGIVSDDSQPSAKQAPLSPEHSSPMSNDAQPPASEMPRARSQGNLNVAEPVTSSSAPPASRTDVTEVPIADAPSQSGIPFPLSAAFRWSGGGVGGAPGAAAVQTFLSRLFRDVFHSTTATRSSHSVVCDAILEGPEAAAAGDATSAATAADNAFERLVDAFNKQGLQRDDCWIHLTPHQRAACLMYASADLRPRHPCFDHPQPSENRSIPAADAAAGDFVDLRHRRVYLESYCSTMVPCLQWQRGSFSIPLNATFLERVFKEEVIPSVLHDDEYHTATTALTRNFVHSAENLDELPWLAQRLAIQERHMATNFALFLDWKRQADGKGRSSRGNGDLRSAAPFEDSTPVFQGMRVAYDGLRREARVSSRETGEELRMPHFTSLQVLAILHHKVFAGYHRRKRYDRDTAADKEDRLSDDPQFRPNMNVIVFSGDSMNREFFMRIVHHIRFGLDPPEGNPFLRQTPFHEPSQQHDMVYCVYEAHDELLLFHSQMSDGRSGHTVQAFFQRLKWEVRHWEARKPTNDRFHGGSGPPLPPNVALLYLVYYWDPQTDYFRKDTIPDASALSRTIASHSEVIMNATYAGAGGDAGRALHLGIHAERKKRKLLEDHLVGTSEHSPCEVQFRMANGQIRALDFSRPRLVAKLPWGRDRGTARLGVAGQAQPARLAAGGTSATARRALTAQDLQFTQQGGLCTPERRAVADRFRRSVLQQFDYRVRPKPVVPLREFGVRIPLHVEGHVFWELERNVELMQQLFAAAISTDDDLPTGQNAVPRRAVAKDQTDLVMFTASYQEDLQPGLRHLSPLFPTFRTRTSEGLSSSSSSWSSTGLVLSGNGRMSDDDMGVEDNDMPLEEAFAKLMRESAPGEAVEESGETKDNVERTAGGHRDREAANRARRAVVQPSNASRSAEHRQRRTVPWTDELNENGVPIQRLRLPRESHHNLIKNAKLFSWFEQLVHHRALVKEKWVEQERQLLRAQGGDARRRFQQQTALLQSRLSRPFGVRTPFRYYKSVALLDMGKLQTLGFAQGDNRHFSCRYVQVKDMRSFSSTFDHQTLGNVLSIGHHRQNQERALCHHSTNQSTDSPHHVTSQEGDIQGISPVQFADYVLKRWQSEALRKQRWRDSGMEHAERQDSRRHFIMHFDDHKEYGAILHDDHDRCVDDGNLFLAEVLYSYLVQQDVEEERHLAAEVLQGRF